MSQPTIGSRLRYQFDNLMARGPAVLIGWLFLASALMILVMSAIIVLFGLAPAGDDGTTPGFGKVAWLGLMHALDVGTLGGDTGSAAFLGVMLLITFGGVFLVSILIGLLTTGIDSKLSELRKGRSRVIETGHTVILGWSSQVFPVAGELILANENQRRACIAILADADKVEMEDQLRARLPDTKTTRMVCRSGSPLDPVDLELVNPQEARSILILSPEGDDPDAQVLKMVLALVNSPNRSAGKYHIVAQVRDARNLELLKMVGRGEVEVVSAEDFVARTMVQTCRQAGLSVVWTELLDFGGDEIYFHDEPALVGRTFGEALLAFEGSAVIGLRTADGVRVNPPMETVIAPGDRIIAISADDDTIRPAAQAPPVDDAALREPRVREPEPERILILGWNRRGPIILRELDSYVAPGTAVTVVAAQLDEVPLDGEPVNERVTLRPEDPTDRRVLDDLDLPSYDHVVVLSNIDGHDAQEADSQTLTTLLHLRDIEERRGEHYNIVSEMIDPRNRELADVTRADDFIVSDQLISLMMSQLSENKELAAVFADLLDADGSELYVKPVEDYLELGRPVTFATAVEAARRRGEVAIGYRLAADGGDAEKGYGIRVNPPKSARVTFGEADRLVVLAED